ncbi:UvrD-helicase domain-containing protein, partial [Priestia megaterium]|uniref:UvrD-helicase domain-containing protein n=1 Tax=Priestia megaterium TaxID=1404 RepID=UPI0021C115D1
MGYWKKRLVGVKDVRGKEKWDEDVEFLYGGYEEVKKEKEVLDFDEMVYGCYEMVKENGDLVSGYEKRFGYFLIEEFEDMNKVEYKIMKMVSEECKKLCVVGDDDDSIYVFGGRDV